MELVFSKGKKKSLQNTYKIVVTFMIGDADGYKELHFTFSLDWFSIPENKTLTYNFIKSIQSCIELDSHGRCGFDNTSELIDWYGFGFDRCGDKYDFPYMWATFCKNTFNHSCKYGNNEQFDLLHKSFKESLFSYYIPVEPGGWYTSYDSIDVYYYDEFGNEFEMDIID